MNFGDLEALICIVSPVSGFLPSLAARSDTSNVPKPTSCTLSPFFSCSATTSVNAFSAFSASFFDSYVLSAIAATSSVLFIVISSSGFNLQYAVFPQQRPVVMNPKCFYMALLIFISCQIVFVKDFLSLPDKCPITQPDAFSKASFSRVSCSGVRFCFSAFLIASQRPGTSCACIF